MLAVGVETDSQRTGHVGLDLDALETVLMQNRVKFIFVTPDFHNPTGTALPLAERRRLLEIAARYQVPVIEDTIYARLRFRGTALPSLKSLDRYGNVIQIDSFSKIAFPGLRVGWCIGPESVIERLRLVKQSTDLHTDQLAQAALAEFIRRGYLARHLAKMRKVYRGGWKRWKNALEKHMPEETTWTRPEGGMSVWLTLAAGLRRRRIPDSRARARSAVRSGAPFLRAAPAAQHAAAGFCESWTKSASPRGWKRWATC